MLNRTDNKTTSLRKEGKEGVQYSVTVLGLALQLGFGFALPVVVCLFLGLWLDSMIKTSPLFLLIGVAIGFTIGLIQAYKVVKFMEKMP